MKNSKSMEFRLGLPRLVKQIHRDAALACMRTEGIEVRDWNDEIVKTTLAEDMHDKGQIIHQVEFDRSPVGIQLAGTRTLESMLVSSFNDVPYDPSTAGKPDMTSVFETVEERGCKMNCTGDRRFRGSLRAGGVDILMLPDSPPFAIYEEDVRYLHDTAGYGVGDDLNILPHLEEAFGPDAIEFLDESACAALIAALPKMHPRIPYDSTSDFRNYS